MKQSLTIGDLLTVIEEGYQNPKAVSSFIDGSWESLSTQEFTSQIKYISLGLIQLGVKRGEMIGIVALPSARWNVVDLAIMAIGAVSVPLFANISEENFLFEVAQTHIKTVFLSGQDAWGRYYANKELFHAVISLDDSVHPENVFSYSQIIDLGKALDEEKPQLFKETLKQLKPDDMATIIYTSGSTGTPKGAVHTHHSIVSILHAELFEWDPETDSYLNVLPLAHVFGRIFNFIMLYWGISSYYFNDLKSLGKACGEIHPTIIALVPRLLEKIYSKMISKIQEEGHMKKAIGQWAFDLANQEEETLWKHIFHPIAEKLVYGHLRDALGGKLRVVISGGAALDPHLNHFFQDIGVPIYEGWGLTESCPVTINRKGHVKIGTVGQKIADLVVKISPDGEILVRGSNVMKGYYKNEEATAKALDSEGWLHTGDKGSVDEDGFLKITGRLKEILKTSTGEAIVPVPIEHALCQAPFIETAVVIGEKRKFASCLLVPNFEILKSLKKSLNVETMSDEEFLESEYIQKEMNKLINQINEHLNHWEKLHAYRFITHPLTIDHGELTPSMKIVREVIERRYQNLIDSIYGKEVVI